MQDVSNLSYIAISQYQYTRTGIANQSIWVE